MRLYEYAATPIRVIDGDTVVLDVDLGFQVHIQVTARLYGIDAAEVRAEPERAAKATEHLTKMLEIGPITCRTYKTKIGKDKAGKYGRYLVQLSDCFGKNINQSMVEDGYAEVYVGW